MFKENFGSEMDENNYYYNGITGRELLCQEKKETAKYDERFCCVDDRREGEGGMEKNKKKQKPDRSGKFDWEAEAAFVRD